jgi:hypothetical protein
VKNIGTKLFKFGSDEPGMSLEKRIVAKAFVHGEGCRRPLESKRNKISFLCYFGLGSGVNIYKGKPTFLNERHQPVARHRNAVHLEK